MLCPKCKELKWDVSMKQEGNKIRCPLCSHTIPIVEIRKEDNEGRGKG